MLTLTTIGIQLAARRKKLGLTQAELARRALVSRATVDALENGRTGELGFTKVCKLISAVGLALNLDDSGPRRPTLDELLEEDRHDKSLERGR